jgi:hypothetical protein
VALETGNTRGVSGVQTAGLLVLSWIVTQIGGGMAFDEDGRESHPSLHGNGDLYIQTLTAYPTKESSSGSKNCG